MTITIITIGNKPPEEIATLIAIYTKRLPSHIQLEWRYIKHGGGNKKTALEQEATQIEKTIQQNTNIVLLDETGIQQDSETLSKFIFTDRQDCFFIIGGAYGVDERIKQRANHILSLSKLVFPHQLVRLILAEQLYRAYTIATDHPYHHS